jgi:alkaline phosphatase D
MVEGAMLRSSHPCRSIGRRALLAGAASLAAMRALAPAATGAAVRPRKGGYPFALGVASGDPLPDGFVVWTRLAPDPLTPGGGMPPEPVRVQWEVAADEQMRRPLRQGVAVAVPEHAHAVHVELRGLEPDHWYWYRFRVGGEASRVGRARTAPLPGAPFGRFRFAFASCQHWEQGYFAAYRHMLADDLDLVVHLGDYIYEVSSWADEVRRHDGPEPLTLDDYRIRHALYKTDPDLQAAHAACPWAVTWDDHEVDNDYAADQSQDREDPQLFVRRRAAAYQAYWEHMPLRRTALPRGADMRLYHRLTFGDLVELSVLDNRQYRSDQPCGEGKRGGGNLVEGCAARLEAGQSMLGPEQERWLLRGLERSRARWNVIAQQQLMAELRQRTRTGAEAYWTDGWDGYAAARGRILAHLTARQTSNPIVIGGDIHSFWVNDLKSDFRDPRAPAVATEFVATSVTSLGVPYETFAALLPDNPHVRFFESRQRGYVRCGVTAERWQADLRAVSDVRDRAATARTLASFVVEAGRPGAVRA